MVDGRVPPRPDMLREVSADREPTVEGREIVGPRVRDKVDKEDKLPIESGSCSA
jgi:hypothetical protein